MEYGKRRKQDYVVLKTLASKSKFWIQFERNVLNFDKVRKI